MAFFCVLAGCWQEIEYHPPDPVTVTQRRAPSPPAEKTAGETPAPSVPPTFRSDSNPAIAAPIADEPADEPPGEPALSATADVSDPEAPDFIQNEGAPDTDMQLDEPQREQPAATDANLDTLADADPPPPADENAPPAVTTTATREAAWRLGSKLSLAALAHDRGLVPKDVATWFAEARTAAELLGTSVAELPESAAGVEGDASSRRVHDYLFQQGQQVWRDLSGHHGGDHAALFELAVKSNVLLVLYEPGSAAADAIASSIREAAPQAGLPLELWRPLVETLANQSPAAAVRAAVRRLHADVEQYLTVRAEQ